jgi:hypothetical protein
MLLTLGDLLSGQTVSAAQRDPSPAGQRPRRLVPAQLRFQKTAVLISESNR